jgi:DNA-binding response OmpR family regulator
LRILLVEDDVKIANAIKKGLVQESYAVDVAYTGTDGLDYALTSDYDLLILDRMLPGIADGMEICKAVRDHGKKTPILVLTAKDRVDDKVFGLNSGADDYLIKPFDFNELLARIKALLRRPENIVGTVLKAGDLNLDTIKKRVERSGKEIVLSSTEFSLLEYLMRNQKQTVSKDAIIEHVWNFDADVLPNTVEVYIGYLRKKIDKPLGSEKLIHTVRGFGYRIGSNR